MRAGMGDLYAGVFSPDEAWRDEVVQAGNASGDLAWPWPLHPRYRPLIESTVADLRNTAGKGFGYPIVAATFLAQFAGDGPWAHVDMLGPALLDEDRGDAFGRGASGYGVRMLVELATRLSAARPRRRAPRRYAGVMNLGDGDRRVAPATPGRVVDASKFDLAAAERAARDLLRAIGADLDAPELRETPRRVAASFAELVTPADFEATLFPNEGYDELVLVREISFQTLCMHHLLPFHGVAHVAYLPGERIIGISKLARVVEAFARDLQLQERMTVQIADWLEQELAPRGVGVVLSAEHMCMTIRGVRKPGARTVTSAVRGSLRDDPRTRQEFFSLVG